MRRTPASTAWPSSWAVAGVGALLEGNHQQVSHGSSIMGSVDRFALTTIGTVPDRHPGENSLEFRHRPPYALRACRPGPMRRPRRGMAAGGDPDESWNSRWVPRRRGGGCVGRAPDGKVVFVRHSLPGERVRARVTSVTSSYLRADAIEILSPSPDRVAAPCPHAGPGRCGGCDYQHVDPAAQRRLKAFRIAEQLGRLAGVRPDVEVEQVDGADGTVAGLGWRTRVRVAVDARGAVGFRRHRSPPARVRRPLPHGQRRRLPPPAPSASAGPAPTEVEIVTGPGSSEAMVSVTPAAGRRLRLPSVEAGLVVAGKVRRPRAPSTPSWRAGSYRISPGVFWQVHVGAAAALLSGGPGRGDAPAGGQRRRPLRAGRGCSRSPWPRRWAPRDPSWPSSATGAACADARHNGATFPNLRVLEGDVTPALVEKAAGAARPGGARSGPGGRRDERHGRAGRHSCPHCRRWCTSRAIRRRSGATSACCSMRDGASPGCARSTSSR